MNRVIAIIAAYLLGSIPSAYYAGILAKGIDLRQEGSGNLGATNTLRVLGAKWGVPVLLFDFGKGAAAILLARWLVPEQDLWAALSGLAAILGHNWTIFLGFRGGGKGVAASAGVFAALTPIPFLITLATFLIVLFTSKYMSLASISGALTLAIACVALFAADSAFGPKRETLFFVLIAAALLIIRHTSNIKRLLQGTENRFSFRKKEPS